MSRTRWYGRMVGGLVLVVMLGVGLQPGAAQRASLSSIDAKLDLVLQADAKLDLVLQALDELTPQTQPFLGDGVSGPPLRYQDNGDGTVTDLNTGLMWEKKGLGGNPGPPGPGFSTCLTILHGVDSTCTWAQANLDWINAINAEGGTGFAGHNDWRFPNIRELMSIVDYGLAGPAIDPIFGPTTRNYWSSTSLAHFITSDAWLVKFDSGGVEAIDKDNTLRVRAVRGGRLLSPARK